MVRLTYFRRKYRVIVMDSRDHGKSSDSPDALTFEAMTDDLSAFLTHLAVGPAYVLGWSDGATEGLLLGMRHPEQVIKIAAMAANLDPGDVYLEFQTPSDPTNQTKSTHPQSRSTITREHRAEQLDRDEPHINPKSLEAIKIPTLVMASDHDVVRDEATLVIYHHLPNSQLAIFPNATHTIPFDNPELFNTTVEHFFSTTFVKKDRVKDLMASVEKTSTPVVPKQ